jgi:hypothetical protein
VSMAHSLLAQKSPTIDNIFGKHNVKDLFGRSWQWIYRSKMVRLSISMWILSACSDLPLSLSLSLCTQHLRECRSTFIKTRGT